MVGKRQVIVGDNKVKFTLDLERKITVLRGKSSTGKSHLYSLLEDSLQSKTRSVGVHCNCTSSIVVLSSTKWQDAVLLHNKIIFADEYEDALFDSEFLSAVSTSDNYFVFITRKANLLGVSFSVNSIFSLNVDAKEGDIFCTRMSHMYSYKTTLPVGAPDVVITEDTNSGFRMFSDLVSRVSTIPVISAGGKDNIINKLWECKGKGFTHPYVIADGAAFGARAQQIFSSDFGDNFKVELFVPESFEWMLLGTRVFSHDITTELTETWNFCDAAKWTTWEQYFTDLTVLLSARKGTSYSKSRLTSYFRTDAVKQDIADMLYTLELCCYLQEED